MEKHIHKYKRFLVGKGGHMIFRCMIPGCSHFIPNKELVIGAISQCWGDCGNTVILNYLHTSTNQTGARPLCQECKDTKRRRREMLSA